MVDELKIERYKFVTDRQKYFTELSKDSFNFFVKILIGVITGAVTILSLKEKLDIEPKLLSPIITLVGAVVTILGAITIIQIAFCLNRWKGFRKAEIEIYNESPKIKGWYWAFEFCYIFAILLSIIATWVILCGVSSGNT